MPQDRPDLLDGRTGLRQLHAGVLAQAVQGVTLDAERIEPVADGLTKRLPTGPRHAIGVDENVLPVDLTRFAPQGRQQRLWAIQPQLLTKSSPAPR
jgi:hypothetical protein